MGGSRRWGAERVFLWTPLLLLVAIDTVNAADCNLRPQSTCICDMSDNSGYIDLSAINNGGQNPKPFFTGVKVSNDENDDYTYSYNPCTGFTDGTCTPNNGVCQSSRASCGRQYSKFDMTTTPPTITYLYGDLFPDTSFGNRSSVIKLVCDNNAGDTMTYDTENPKAVYHFIVTSKHACVQSNPTPPSSHTTHSGSHAPQPNALTLGWIIDISALLLLMTYFGAGFAFKFGHQGARGREAIPNYIFWSELPSLIKEGFLLLWGKVRSGSNAGYDAI